MDTLQTLASVEFWQDLWEQVSALPYFWYAVAGVFLFVLIWLNVRCKTRVIHLFSNTSGQITVSRSALKDLIQNVCQHAGVASKAAINIRIKRNKIYIIVGLRLQEDQSLAELSNDIQQSVTIALKENLNIDNLGGVDISMTRFASNKYNKPSKSKKTKDTYTIPAVHEEETEEK